MQTALAESEARHQTAMDGLRAENTVLQRKVTALETKTVKLETDLAAKVDQSSFNGHWHGCHDGTRWERTRPPYDRGY